MDYHLVIARLRPGSEYQSTGLPGYAGIGAWRDPKTVKPTNAECITEWNKYQAEVTTAATELSAARSAILTTAQSAVGVRLVDLTAAQIKSLMACLLYAAGGVDVKTMTVRPLAEWMK